MISYGTAEAVERLADTYGDLLLRLAAARLRHTADAEDAVQEVFLYLLEHGVTFKNETHEKAWLIRATLHRAADLRKRAAKKDLPLEEASEPAAPEVIPPPPPAGRCFSRLS